jgi:hypothetical protein
MRPRCGQAIPKLKHRGQPRGEAEVSWVAPCYDLGLDWPVMGLVVVKDRKVISNSRWQFVSTNGPGGIGHARSMAAVLDER